MSNDIIYLNHIFAAMEQIDRYTRGMSESEFLSRAMVQDAVVRQIEIIGEAARNVSQLYRDAHPEIPWRKIIAQRHVLAHEYGEVKHESI